MDNVYEKRYGTRLEVFRGIAYETTGRLKKKDLYKNRHGRIVSIKRSLASKRINNLKDYINPPGIFQLHPKKIHQKIYQKAMVDSDEEMELSAPDSDSDISLTDDE